MCTWSVFPSKQTFWETVLQTVRVSFEVGHCAVPRTQVTEEGFTHDWEVYVKSTDGLDLPLIVDKVVFTLHEDFPNPQRGTLFFIRCFYSTLLKFDPLTINQQKFWIYHSPSTCVLSILLNSIQNYFFSFSYVQFFTSKFAVTKPYVPYFLLFLYLKYLNGYIKCCRFVFICS